MCEVFFLFPCFSIKADCHIPVADMASSMTTTANGVKIVTHIIPLDEKIDSPNLKVTPVESEDSKLPPIAKMFLKGRPMTLGVRD